MSLDDARFAIRKATDRLEGFAAEVDRPSYFLALGVQVGMDCGPIPSTTAEERTFGLSWHSMVGDFHRLEVDQATRAELMTKDVVESWREQDEAEAKGLPWEPAVCTGHALYAILKGQGGAPLGGAFPTLLDTVGQAANILAAAEGYEVKAPRIPGRMLWLAHVMRLAAQRPAAFGARVRWLHANSIIQADPPVWGGFQASLDARPLFSPGSYVIVLEQDIRTASATAARLMLAEERKPDPVWLYGTLTKLRQDLGWSARYSAKLRQLEAERKIILEQTEGGLYRMRVLSPEAYNPHPPGNGGEVNRDRRL